MDEDLEQAVSDKLLALADDELLLGHRNSEWTGHAPILEEDIAIANLAQDELGHARLWYDLYEQIRGVSADALVFQREAQEFRSCQLVELPRGDWALTLVRQYLFDAAETVWLAHFKSSRYPPVAGVAAKIQMEELYHLRHSQAWIKRLGLGTEESHRRTQMAVDVLWPFALQLFVALPGEERLVVAGFFPDSQTIRSEWESMVRPFLATCGLALPQEASPVTLSRDQHSPHLEALLADMQSVARADPGAHW